MNYFGLFVIGVGVLAASSRGEESAEAIFSREAVVAKDDQLSDARKMLELMQAGETEKIELGQSVEGAAEEASERAMRLAAEHGVSVEEIEVEARSVLSKENQAKLESLEALLAKGVPDDYRRKLIEMGQLGFLSKETSGEDRVYYQKMLEILNPQELQAEQKAVVPVTVKPGSGLK